MRMVQVRAQKNAGSKLLWNLPPSFMEMIIDFDVLCKS